MSERLKLRWWLIEEWLLQRPEKIAMWAAWHAPKSWVYWAFIRLATSGERHGETYHGNPAEQSVIEAMKRWEST